MSTLPDRAAPPAANTVNWADPEAVWVAVFAAEYICSYSAVKAQIVADAAVGDLAEVWTGRRDWARGFKIPRDIKKALA